MVVEVTVVEEVVVEVVVVEEAAVESAVDCGVFSIMRVVQWNHMIPSVLHTFVQMPKRR